MGTAVKHTVPDRVKPWFLIFDIRALWCSVCSISSMYSVHVSLVVICCCLFVLLLLPVVVASRSVVGVGQKAPVKRLKQTVTAYCCCYCCDYLLESCDRENCHTFASSHQSLEWDRTIGRWVQHTTACIVIFYHWCHMNHFGAIQTQSMWQFCGLMTG